jgi:hypothetical protein
MRADGPHVARPIHGRRRWRDLTEDPNGTVLRIAPHQQRRRIGVFFAGKIALVTGVARNGLERLAQSLASRRHGRSTGAMKPR